ncbi:MAG: pseudouridine synthase [Gemmatimonadota bacterium]|nr:pseudouridine synthase [Gemmatimonadota bacterium]MEC9318186.1 pseudouridine synthase [Gemmatimonadota bacterium]
MTEGIRLQKYISRCGRASRRQAEVLMLAGRVRVNGELVSELGTRIIPGRDTVHVDDDVLELTALRWIAFHKPTGVLTTRRDPHGGLTIYDVLPEECSTLRYVGRLDRESEGLLILTNDGDVAHGIQHPSRQVERVYRVVVTGILVQSKCAALLRGVELEDGVARVNSVDVLDKDEFSTTIEVVLTEGRKREVRRMMNAIGHGVRRLVRIRFGPVKLGELPVGEWRDLDESEKNSLRTLAERGKR